MPYEMGYLYRFLDGEASLLVSPPSKKLFCRLFVHFRQFGNVRQLACFLVMADDVDEEGHLSAPQHSG